MYYCLYNIICLRVAPREVYKYMPTTAEKELFFFANYSIYIGLDIYKLL